MSANKDPLQQARRHLLERGTVLPGVLDERLARSWERSLNVGLEPGSRQGSDTGRGGQASFARLLRRNEKLLAFARPVLDFVYTQIQGGHCMLALADAQCTLMHTLGDDAFLDRAQRVALSCGESWSEQRRGTNAIGTAVVERSVLRVRGNEHFLVQNGFLHCSAAPVFTAQGEVAGVIDISGDEYASQRHALGLASSAARMIENNWLKAMHAGHVRIHLHARAEGLGTPAEGIVALTEEGVLAGANPEGMRLLGLSHADFFTLRLENRLQQRLTELLAHGGKGPRILPMPNGQRLYMRIGLPAGSRLHAPPAPARAHDPGWRGPASSRPDDALAALDTGDAQWRLAIERVRRILDKPIPLLILGESGAGKEVFARACHDSGPRRGKPFVAINCAAIPEALIEAELFGYAPGAYTGAQRGGNPGRIREADGGTLFLDEIGDMPPLLQTRLLRVLQERMVIPLGGGAAPVDFALISATHRPLDTAVTEGGFRQDLYYRVNGFSVQLPALRDRTDFEALAAGILRVLGEDCAIAPDVLAAFKRYAWPGNLRQLTNVLQTACALREPDEPCIDWPHLADDLRQILWWTEGAPAAQGPLRAAASSDSAAHTLKAMSQRALRAAMREAGNNVSEVARRLGISRQTVYRRLRDGD